MELPGEPERWRPADVRGWLRDHGLAPVALTASCMTPTERDLAHPDPRIRAVAVDYVIDALASIAYGGAIVVEIMAPGPDPFRAIKDARSAEILDGDIRESLARLRARWPPPGKRPR